MKTSQFMDKQIMDLTASGSTAAAQRSSSKDDFLLDLLNNHLRPPQNDAGNARGDSFRSSTDAQINYSNLDEEDKIFPSYDFQPISGSAAAPRAWASADSKSSPLKSYASLDFVEPPKEVVGEERAAAVDMAVVVSEVDRAMKKHADNLLHVLEGVSARLTQLESRTRSLESSVDDLKVSVGNNHGSTDGKMRQLENILREVQSGVQVLKDKQEIVEAQLQLSKIQVSKEDQPPPQSQNTVNMDAAQQEASAPPQSRQQLHPPAAASAPSQSHQQLHPPVSFPQTMPPPPPPFHPPAVAQQNLQPPAPLPSQFPPNQIHPTPQRDSYFPPPGQELPSQQYQVPTSQPSHPPSATLPHPSPAAPSHLSPAAPPHQPYQPPPQSQYPQQPPPTQPQPSLGHHPEETSYIPSQSYPLNLRQPSPQPPNGVPPSQQYYGASMYEPPSSRPGSAFSAGYGTPPVGPSEPYPYGGSASQYGGSPAVKPPQLSSPAMSQGGGSGYPQLPTARILPQALPTASGISGGSNPSGTGNRVPIDDVVDRVTTMGFPREQVRATVRKLTENGQSVDLNIVLDKLMNDGEGQSKRVWFGR